MRILVPIIALVVAVGVFLGPTRTALDASKPLVQQRLDLNAALDSAKRIQTVRETLQEQYNSFSSDELNRLKKMVPSHVDNVRLVIDINGMASTYGMLLKDIQVGQSSDVAAAPGAGTLVGDGPEHLDIRFTVSGTYDSLKLFVQDLGRSLRIVDITDLTFMSKDTDIYDFTIGLRTYWLQDK